jgi:fructokinase
MRYGGIEAGGTKWVCGVGDGDGRLLERQIVPTTTPQQTIARATEFFRGRKLDGLGIASFGPIDARHESPTFGQITGHTV